MIGLDTNVLVRYLVQDDAIQAAAATTLIENMLSASNLGFISVVAITETAWVLQRAYRLTHAMIASALEALLASDVFVVECETEVMRAIIAVRRDHASFADALIGELGARNGCDYTATFDRNAARSVNFRLVQTA